MKISNEDFFAGLIFNSLKLESINPIKYLSKTAKISSVEFSDDVEYSKSPEAYQLLIPLSVIFTLYSFK